MSNVHKIVLGTVQFGLNYGVNNTTGKQSEEAIFKILKEAYQLGIDTLDTAEAYGNAHDIISRFHKQSKIRFRIITKFSSSVLDKYPLDLIERIEYHCKSFQITHLESYMFHSYAEFKEALNKDSLVLQKLTNSKYVKKIGVSLHTNGDIENVLNYKGIELIQLPFNLFDNELSRSQILKKTKLHGVEIHTRSAFLQGLFFKDVNSLKGNLVHLVEELNFLKKLLKENDNSLTSFALNYPISKDYIDKVVIGIDNIEQLHDNINSVRNHKKDKSYNQIDTLRIKNTELLNPSNWKL